MGTLFSVGYHHTSSFVKDPNLRYEGLEEYVFYNLDVDKWSYYATLKIVMNKLISHRVYYNEVKGSIMVNGRVEGISFRLGCLGIK